MLHLENSMINNGALDVHEAIEKLVSKASLPGTYIPPRKIGWDSSAWRSTILANCISGTKKELATPMSSHMDINALGIFSQNMDKQLLINATSIT